MGPAAMALACLLWAAPPPASGDARERANALVAEGAELGKAGRFAEAIERFRAAEAVFPRAIHACNIGLAYLEWGQWPLAHLYLSRCQLRATSVLPDWVAEEQATALGKLRAGEFAPVAISAQPASASLRLDTMAGETFGSPITLWLPFGAHEVTAELDGHVGATTRVTITSREAVRATFELVAEPTHQPEARVQPEAPEPLVTAAPRDEPSSPWPWVTAGAGAAALATGVALHVVSFDTHAEALALEAGPTFEKKQAAFRAEYYTAFVMYGVAAAAAGVTVWLLVAGDDGDDEPVTVGVGPGAVTVRAAF